MTDFEIIIFIIQSVGFILGGFFLLSTFVVSIGGSISLVAAAIDGSSGNFSVRWYHMMLAVVGWAMFFLPMLL